MHTSTKIASAVACATLLTGQFTNGLKLDGTCALGFGYIFGFPVAAVSGATAIMYALSQDMFKKENQNFAKKCATVFAFSAATHMVCDYGMRSSGIIPNLPEQSH